MWNKSWLLSLLLDHFANLLIFAAWATQSSPFQNQAQLPHLLFQSSHSSSALKTDYRNIFLAHPSWGHSTNLKPSNVSLPSFLGFEELTALCSEMFSKTPQGFVLKIRIVFHVTKSQSTQSSACFVVYFFFFPRNVKWGRDREFPRRSFKEWGWGVHMVVLKNWLQSWLELFCGDKEVGRKGKESVHS